MLARVSAYAQNRCLLRSTHENTTHHSTAHSWPKLNAYVVARPTSFNYGRKMAPRKRKE
jgi:hypothetical protein